jgi:hypothetical protein
MEIDEFDADRSKSVEFLLCLEGVKFFSAATEMFYGMVKLLRPEVFLLQSPSAQILVDRCSRVSVESRCDEAEPQEPRLPSKL